MVVGSQRRGSEIRPLPHPLKHSTQIPEPQANSPERWGLWAIGLGVMGSGWWVLGNEEREV